MFKQADFVKLFLRGGEEFTFLPERYEGEPLSYPHTAMYNENLVIRYEFRLPLHGDMLAQELEQLLAPKLGGYLQLTAVEGIVLIELFIDGLEGHE